MSETKQENKNVDPIVASSLIVLGSNIVNTLIKYNDINLQAPTAETLKAQLDAFKKMIPLPEDYDVGLVQESWDFIKDKFGL
jgi:hypothetical protein